MRQLLAPWWHKIYNLLMAGRRKAFYRGFIEPGDLCFDVGANIGNRTDIFLQLQARVIAIEPQPACVQTLGDQFGNRITIVAKGLGAQEGHLDMHLSNNSTLSTFSAEWIARVGQERFADYRWRECISVPITTLDALIRIYGLPKFCKIDVEGFELQVLQGLSQPIPIISFEYTIPEAKENLRVAVERLTTLSAHARFNYSPGESMKLALPDYITATAFFQLIDTPAFNRTDFGDVYVKSMV